MGELNRLIDNGQCVLVYRNQLGSVTAACVHVDEPCMEDLTDIAESADHLTDDQSIETAMSRLADKMFCPKQPHRGE